jgi:ribosomal protein S18 acetylase RimI-like enzyme
MDNPSLNLKMEWSTDHSKADIYVDLLFECLSSDFSYISHSEIQEGRALSQIDWNPDLKRILYRSIVNHLSQVDDDGGQGEIAIVLKESEVVGLLQVSYGKSPNGTYAVLEDLVVRAGFRDQGIGDAFLQWLKTDLRKKNVVHIFLESGNQNNRAHKFFERLGYKTLSKVMVLTL